MFLARYEATKKTSNERVIAGVPSPSRRTAMIAGAAQSKTNRPSQPMMRKKNKMDSMVENSLVGRQTKSKKRFVVFGR